MNGESDPTDANTSTRVATTAGWFPVLISALALAVVAASCGSGTGNGRNNGADIAVGTEETTTSSDSTSAEVPETQPTDSVPTDSTGGTTTTAIPPTSAPQQSGDQGSIEGRAVDAGDNSDLPGTAIVTGAVLFFEAETTELLPGASGLDSTDGSERTRPAVELDAEQLAAIGGIAVPIDADGRFSINLAPGRYFVCLANTSPGQGSGPPYVVDGCGAVTLGGSSQLTITLGAGVVTVEAS